MPNTIGIIGLGIMGSAISANLIARGWEVFGTDIVPAKRDAFATAGGTACTDVAAVAAAAPVLLTSLPTPAALAEVAAVIAATAEPRVVIETSTMALADKLAAHDVLAAAGHTALDCTISGTGAQAVNRDLVIYASGDAATIAASRPLFDDFARATHDLGAYGNGTRMKFVANLLVAIHNVATAEAMVLANAAGLDPDQVVEVIASGAGTSRVFELRAPAMAARRYDQPTARVSMFEKDVSIIGAFAAALGLQLPAFEASQAVYAEAAQQGLREHDVTAVHAVLERRIVKPD